MKFEQKMIVVSAPSGTGKTTLNKRFLSHHPSYQMVTSHTSRPRRDQEVSGHDYHFTDVKSFETKIEKKQMLEWAKVFNNYYGTSIEELQGLVDKGITPLLEIDIKGWKMIQPKVPHALSIFIFPPKVEDLWQRLKLRATESEEVRWRRLKTARDEIASAKNYDFFLINQNLDQAYLQLESIILKEKTSMTIEQGSLFAQGLLKEFDQASWYQDLKGRYGES